MNSYIMMKAFGVDRPGILSMLTSRIKDYDANIDIQRISVVAHEFSMLLLISVEENRKNSLLSLLNGIKGDDFTIQAHAIDSLSQEGKKTAILSLHGKDEIGISGKLTSLLVSQNVNITELRQDIKDEKFSLTAQLEFPKTINVEELERTVQEMKKDFDVIVSLKTGV